MLSALEQSLQRALDRRQETGPLYTAEKIVPIGTADFTSNDYLSISSNPTLRREFLKTLESKPYLFGARGSRPGGGTSLEYLELEAYFRDIFNVPAALIINNGYLANVAFIGCVPQPGDVLLYDPLVHASTIDGMRVSRARDSMITFEHNTMESLEAVLKKIIEENPMIASGKATLFIFLESTYSMDGVFCHLVEAVDLVEKYIPRESTHFVVDDAHGLGLYGPQGRGLVALWGLQHRIHTVIHPLTKSTNMIGAVILTTPTIVKYMANYARPLMFGSALPYVDVFAIKHSFDLVMGPIGEERRQKLQQNSRFFSRLLEESFSDIPTTLLSWPNRLSQVPSPMADDPGSSVLTSPIFPILTPRVTSLQRYLHKHGYSITAVAFPVVPKGLDRLRVVLHAGNSEKEMTEFVGLIRSWALYEMAVTVEAASQVGNKFEEIGSPTISKL